MEKKNLKEVIAKIKEFVEGKISEKEIDEFGNSLNIRAYIPILDKLKLAITIVSKQEYSNYETLEIKMAEFYKDMFFLVLLGGYAMLEVDDEDCTYDNYDLLYPVLGTWLLSYCGNDYAIILDMIKESMSLYNIRFISDTVNEISEKGLEKAIEENKKIVDFLNENEPLVADLKDIFLATNQDTKKVVDIVNKAIISLADATMIGKTKNNSSIKKTTKTTKSTTKKTTKTKGKTIDLPSKEE